MRSRLTVAVIGAVLAFSVSTAFAVPISVTNFSFETLPSGGLSTGCGAGCSFSSSGDPIPGWTVSGTVGQFQPGVQASNFTYFNSVPDGITVAYSNGGTISQTVGPTVALGVLYTLNVDQGVRKDLPDPGLVELMIGSNAPILATGVPAAPGSGNWSTYTATYIGLPGDVGKSIAIALVSPAAQGDWDNVRLDAAVPEPATIGLVGIGLVAFVGVARRRRGRSVFNSSATLLIWPLVSQLVRPPLYAQALRGISPVPRGRRRCSYLTLALRSPAATDLQGRRATQPRPSPCNEIVHPPPAAKSSCCIVGCLCDDHRAPDGSHRASRTRTQTKTSAST